MIERRKTILETPETEEVVDYLEEQPDPVTVFKCKPTWNFQSIEFEVKGTVNEAILMYSVVLEELKAISPEQRVMRTARVPSKKRPKNPATEKQKEIMDRYGIEYDEYTSKEEARKLIDKSIQESK